MKIGKKEWVYPLILLALLIVIFGFVYRNLWPWRTLVACDLTPWFSSVSVAWQNFTSAWSNIYLGKVGPVPPGDFIAKFFTLILSGDNADTAQGIFYLSLLPLSVLTMYLFLRCLVSSNLARILVSMLYGVNGLTIEWFLAGGYSFLPWHAFFPLLMLYLIKILEGGRWRLLNMLIFSLLYWLISSFQVHMYMLWLFLPFIFIFFIVEIAYQRSRQYTINITLLFIGSAGILLLLLVPILIDEVPNLLSYFNVSSVTSPMYLYGYSQSFLYQAVKDNYALGSTTGMFNKFTYVMVLFTFSALFIRKGKRLIYYLCFLLTGALILLIANLLAVGSILDFFRSFPLLFVIKGPERLAFMLCWAIFPMMAILIEEIQERLHFKIKPDKKLIQVTASVLLCIFFIVPSLLLINGHNSISPFDNKFANIATFFSNGMLKDHGKVDLGRIPESFSKISDWLNERQKTEGFFRTAWLPGYWTVVDKVLTKYNPATFTGVSPSEPDFFMLTLMPLLRGGTKDVGKLLSQFDVKYIVVSLERWEGQYLEPFYKGNPRFVQVQPMGWYAIGDPHNYVELLNEQQDLLLVADNPGFIIYENQDFSSHTRISAYNKMFALAPISALAKAPKAGDILLNSDFEDGFSFWKPNESLKGAEYFIDNTVSHSKKSSLKMEMHEPGSYATVNRKIEVTENEYYNLSVWLKGANIASAGLRIAFRDSQDGYIKVHDESYLGLFLSLGEEWANEECLLYVPKGTVNIDISFDIGMVWSIIDKANPAIGWIDDIMLWKSFSSLSPINNPVYLFGDIDQFPTSSFNSDPGLPGDVLYRFLHGQMLIQVPKLLSKLPYVDNEHHLMVYGDFLPSDEAISQNLDLSNAVVFMGDIDSSKPYAKWTDKPEALLFVYEAEGEIILKSVEKVEGGLPNVLVDDNAVAFWQTGAWGKGNIGMPDISDDLTQKISGSDSLQITSSNGQAVSWYLYHDFSERQDWSSGNSLSLYWFGNDSGGEIRTDVLTSKYDVFQATFKDNFSGWKHVILPFNSFTSRGNPSWDNIHSIDIQTVDDNLSGAWHLDRVSVTFFPAFEYHYIKGESFSYNTALEIKGICEGEKQFFNPRAGYIRVLLRAQDAKNLAIEIDGKPIKIFQSYPGDNDFSLYETAPVKLSTGNHRLMFKVMGDRAIWDQFSLLSTIEEATTFQDVFYTEPPAFTYTELNPSQYNLELKSDEPCFIILKDSFHPEWQATTDSGERLAHFGALPLGWANGFYLDHGIMGEVTLAFERQTPRKISLIICGIASLLVVLSIIFLFRKEIIRSRRPPPGNKAED